MGYNPWVKTAAEARWEWVENIGFIGGGIAIMAWLLGY
jgi:hypothetical protein